MSPTLERAPKSSAKSAASPRRVRWWHAALVLAVFAGTLVAAFPARWLAGTVERATDGRVRIVAPTGSPWQGRGELVVRVEGGDVAAGGVSWQWLPLRLGAGELALSVTLEGVASGDAVFAIQAAAVEMRDARIAVPAAALSEQVAALRGWRPEGTVSVRAHADLGARGALRLRGTATTAPADRERLRPLLVWLGPERADGTVAFDIALPPRRRL
jgi:general secretion pathway protein N